MNVGVNAGRLFHLPGSIAQWPQNSRHARVGTFSSADAMIAAPTKALIIAAGRGSRLKAHTADKPKCMLAFGGKTLLQRQFDVYRACGIQDISLIRGYRKEKIRYKGIRYYENPNYEHNNVLNSLFCAEPAINGHLLVSYSDILFEKHVVQRLVKSEHD